MPPRTAGPCSDLQVRQELPYRRSELGRVGVVDGVSRGERHEPNAGAPGRHGTGVTGVEHVTVCAVDQEGRA